MPELRTMDDDDRRTLSLVLLMAFERGWPIVSTGSRVIGGATDESDYDYVVLIEGFGRRINEQIVSLGFVRTNDNTGNNPYGTRASVATYRSGSLNLIVTQSKTAFRAWVRATDVAQAISPETKEERVTIFDKVFAQEGVPVC